MHFKMLFIFILCMDAIPSYFSGKHVHAKSEGTRRGY